PADAERHEPEREEGVFAHVRGDRQRSVRVQPHEYRPGRRDEDGSNCGWFLREARERKDRRVRHDDVRHRGECGDAAEYLRADGGPVLGDAEEPFERAAHPNTPGRPQPRSGFGLRVEDTRAIRDFYNHFVSLISRKGPRMATPSGLIVSVSGI